MSTQKFVCDIRVKCRTTSISETSGNIASCFLSIFTGRRSCIDFSGTSQAGRLKHRLPGDDFSNMRGSVGFMIFIETILPLRHKDTKTKIRIIILHVGAGFKPAPTLDIPNIYLILFSSATKRSIDSLVFVSVTHRSMLLFSSGYNAEMSNPPIIPFVRRYSLILFMR